MSPILQSLANGSARGYGAFFGAAAAPAFESIASASGDGSSATVTFSSLPTNYTSLQLRFMCKGTRSFVYESLYVRLNGDTGNNYGSHYIYTDNGGGANAVGAASTSVIYAGWMAAATVSGTNMCTGIVDLHDYNSTARNKTVRVFSGFDTNTVGAGYSFLNLSSGVWLNTNAVTSISILSNGAFTTDSRFALYGIKGA